MWPFIQRILDAAPPAVRERVVPFLSHRVFPALRNGVRLACKLVIVYVVLQVIFSQSSTVQRTWAAVKSLAPRPAHHVASAVGQTSAGRVTMRATFAIRHRADRIFMPVHALYARQQERGQEAGHGIMNLQNGIDEARNGVPRIPSVDEQMQRVETQPPPEQP